MAETLKTKVTTYKGFLIIDTPDPKESKGWVPNGPGKIGCVLMGTKERLGVSVEAIELLRKVKRNRDAVGDLMWFKSNKEGHCFGWFGYPRRTIWAEGAEGDRHFAVHDGEYVPIPNDTPETVRQAIDLLDTDDEGANALFQAWQAALESVAPMKEAAVGAQTSWVRGDRVRLKRDCVFYSDSPRLQAKQFRGEFRHMCENDPDGPDVCLVEFEGCSYLGEARVRVYDLEADPDPTPLQFLTVQEKLQKEAMDRAMKQAFTDAANGKSAHVDVDLIIETVRKNLS